MSFDETIYWENGRKFPIVSITIYDKNGKPPGVFHIAHSLGSKGIKNKWTRKRKIRDWLLYNKASCSFATKFRKIDSTKKIISVSKENHLYWPDSEIIKNRFPNISKGIL